ncbi:MAG: DUF2490 domain-containing protein, partial [Ginsengibacter sp.]
MRLRLLVLVYFFSTNLIAQTGSWNIISVKLKINEKWSVFTEAQLRSLSFYDELFYYELKGGASYKLSKNISVTGGLGIYETYSPGGNFKNPKVNDEFRTWLQLDMTQDIKRLMIEHRYRVEQQWTSNGFHHRFRYRLNATLPIAKGNIEPKTFYLNSSEEVFFTNNSPYFIKNRFFAGCGYVFTQLFTCQTGYMQQ